jgi:hypothetical protein
MAQQPYASQGRLIADVSGSHTVTYSRSIEMIWTDDQPDAAHSTQIDMHTPAGFKPTILAREPVVDPQFRPLRHWGTTFRGQL